MVISDDAQRRRGILLELERLYNHVTDIGALCNDVGHGILNAHAGRIREQLLRINDQVTGHRLLRGAVHPGGAGLRQLPDPDRTARDRAPTSARWSALALDHSVVRDRFTGTAVLTAEQARDLGTLGYVARASGLTLDARHDHPTLTAPHPRTVHTRTEGDVLARFLARAEEITTSVAMITTWSSSSTDATATRPHRAAPRRPPAVAAAQRAQAWASSRAGGARSCTAWNSAPTDC